MARYIIDNKVTNPDGLATFNYGGYKFNAKLSQDTRQLLLEKLLNFLFRRIFNSNHLVKRGFSFSIFACMASPMSLELNIAPLQGRCTQTVLDSVIARIIEDLF